MSVIELRPPKHFVIPELEPVTMLLGPIQGAPDWQHDAVEELEIQTDQRYIRRLYVANPRADYLPGEFDYDTQVDWEGAHIDRAMRYGSIVVWFAKQDHDLEYEAGRPYAKTTMKELQRVLAWIDCHQLDPDAVAFGIEPGFEDRLRYERKHITKRGIPILDNLEEVVDKATGFIQEIVGAS